MGGFDDHVAIMGDWMPPSPSPRAFFSSMMGDDAAGSGLMTEASGANKDGTSFPMSLGQSDPANNDKKNLLAGTLFDQTSNPISPHELKSASRGGLLERMAARAGFNAPRLNTENIRPSDVSQNQNARSPYLTIPPGLSPTTLLDSPVFVSNSLVQPSPTTGKFAFTSMACSTSSTMVMENADKSKQRFLENFDSSSFSFKPVPEPGSSTHFAAANRVPPSLSEQSFPGVEVSVHTNNSLQTQNLEAAKVHSQDIITLQQQGGFSEPLGENEFRGSNMSLEQRSIHTVGTVADHSSPLDEQQDEDNDQRGGGDTNAVGTPAEDGYNWRKYGQKQVKGSDYPRSYYKCTHPNCLVKKKVERSHEGHITEIIYKGAHNHPKPPPNRKTLGSSNSLGDVQVEISERNGTGGDIDPVWASMPNGSSSGAPEWKTENLEANSSARYGPEYCNGSGSSFPLHAQNAAQIESAEAIDGSSTFSNDDDEDDRATHGSASLGYEGEGDESESKRRRIETYASEMSGATRAIREPRVVVQTTSEVDILDDGYRWRKYGQKVVKGNPNPRSYYKCTSPGCTVRKHVERASHDLKSVITTYEGKHNHDVPAARNSSHVNSGASNSLQAPAAPAVQTHVQRSDNLQLNNGMARFERPPSLGSFGFAGRPQLGPTPGFGFGMNQQGLANLAMVGLGPSQGKIPALPMRTYLGQPRPINEMGFMLPKGEPKLEPMPDPALNLPSSSSVYSQLMSRLPLGPQM